MPLTVRNPRAFWCRCGASGDGAWLAEHKRAIGKVHKVVIDDYRALCVPHRRL